MSRKTTDNAIFTTRAGTKTPGPPPRDPSKVTFIEIFRVYDYDEDGNIRVEDLMPALRATGLPVRITDIRNLESVIRYIK